VIPEYNYIDEHGIETIDDEELHFMYKYLRDNVKEGNLLNLGSGITHIHQMCANEDKLTEITYIDLQPENNVLVRELIERALNLNDYQKGIRLASEGDVDLLRLIAEAMHKDPSYGIEKSGSETLSSLYKKMQHNGRLDIKTRDMISSMDKLGSGEIVDGRTYDNALMLFSRFTRNPEETDKFISNVNKRINEGGKFIIIDAEVYGGADTESDESALQEGKKVEEEYSEVHDWTKEEMIEILKRAGFKSVKAETHEISEDSDSEQRTFGSRYLCCSRQAPKVKMKNFGVAVRFY